MPESESAYDTCCRILSPHMSCRIANSKTQLLAVSKLHFLRKRLHFLNAQLRDTGTCYHSGNAGYQLLYIVDG